MIASTLTVIDSHTGGEPTRLILEAPLELPKGALAAREFLAQSADWVRTASICEPRGSEVVVGGILVEPSDPSADFAVVFFNNVSYLGMCGHGTIGVVRSMAYLNKIEPGEYKFETPAGLVSARLNADLSVEVDNVEAHRYLHDIEVNVPEWGRVQGDVAYGGNWFFISQSHGLSIHLSAIRDLTVASVAIRSALQRSGITGRDGAEIDHVELVGPSSTADARNFVLCPGLAYDRSPCGTGTSAKLACLAADAKLAPGEIWRQESIIGSVFEGWYQPGTEGILPTIKGTAYVTGEATLRFEPNDPYREGIPV